MLISAKNLQPKNIQPNCLQAKPASLSYGTNTCDKINNKGLNRDSVSFTGYTNTYLNKELGLIKQFYQIELLDILMSEKPLNESITAITKKMFRDFNFELKDIKNVKHTDIAKNPPLIFSKNDFSAKEPKTNIYLNFDKIKNIRNESENPKEKLKNCCFEIGQCIFKNNELNVISKITDEFTAELTKLRKITPKTVKELIEKIDQKHTLDLSCGVIEKKLVPQSGGIHQLMTITTPTGDIINNLIIDFSRSKKSLIREIPHEFNHLLNANSIKFNELPSRIVNQKPFMQGYDECQDALVAIRDKNPDFLTTPIKARQNAYDKLLGDALKHNKINDKKLLIAYIENVGKDEAFAYSKTIGAPEDIKNRESYVSVGTMINDFLNYIQSVKYNESKLTGLVN